MQTRELVSSASLESTDSVVTESSLVVIVSLSVTACTIDLDEYDRVHVGGDSILVVGSLRIHDDINVLVEVNLIWDNVIKPRSVA